MRSRDVAIGTLATVALAAGLWRGLDSVFATPESRATTPHHGPAPTGVPAARASASESEFLKRIDASIADRSETRALLETPPTKIKGLLHDPRFNPAQLVDTAARLQRDLTLCLHQDLCGQRPDPAHAYFAPERTPANRALNHALDLLQAAVEDGAGSVPNVSDEDLLNAMRIPNSDTQIAALDLFLRKPPTDDEYKSLLDASKYFVNEAAVHFFERMQDPAVTAAARRSLYLTALQNALGSFNVALVRDLSRIDLSAAEFQNAATNLCRFKQDPSAEQNWKLARYYIDQYASTRGYAMASNTICPGP